MFKRKSNLDEFQEQRLLKIESKGFWLTFWGLFVVFAIQYMMNFGQEDFFKAIAGELAILNFISVYVVIACIKQGIWSRTMKASPKNSLLLSVGAGLGAGIFVFLVFYFHFHKFQGAMIVGSITAISTFILAIITFAISTSLYKKRLNKLENPNDE